VPADKADAAPCEGLPPNSAALQGGARPLPDLDPRMTTGGNDAGTPDGEPQIPPSPAAAGGEIP